MNAADRRRLTPALGILAVALAALLIALWAGVGRGAHWNDNASPPPLPQVRAATPPPSVPPLENFAVVWEKPLFSPDRKPIAAPAGSNNNASTGDLELTGVIMLPGLHMALLRDKNSGRTLRVRQGQSANGATVVEVKPRSAVVDIHGSRTELPLKVGPSPPGNGVGENGAPASAQPGAEAPQSGEGAPQPAPFSSSPPPPHHAAPQGSGTAPAQPSRSGAAPAQAPPAGAQSGQSTQLTNKAAAEAWAAALKARIQQRRKQAAQKQDANKQNDGG